VRAGDNVFAITEDQIMLADNLRRVLSDCDELGRRTSRLSRANPNRPALWPLFAEQGVLGAAFDDSKGGFAGDARTIAVIMAELGAALVAEPYLATAVVAGRICGRWTDSERSRKATEAIISGDLICVLAHSWHPDPAAAPPLLYGKSPGMVHLTGTIRAVRHGDVAHSFIVPVKDNDNAIHFYQLNRDEIGLRIEPYRLLDASGAADLHFNNVPAPSAAKLTMAMSGGEVLQDALDWGILGVSAEAAGIIESLNSATFSYLNLRRQFGSALSGFQALQHRAADMWIVSEELQAVMGLAIDAMGDAPDVRRSTIMAAARVVADTATRRVGNEAVQLHGGIGVSDELVVSHYFRRLAAIRGEWGNADAHRLRIRRV
jgi:alkylation response protein AidB-like acyl-CoA dehydrogenase